MSNTPITTTSDWTFELVERFYKEIETIAVDELGLDVYPNQIEIISAEQMLDAYSSVGMPIMYNHWSFGKEFIGNHNNYKQGHMGLAYEIVLNTNPCLVYLMEENTMMMQGLVIAHAAFGHNAFFKNNYMFRDWTHADSIVDYLVFAKNYIAECEEKYGARNVEVLLDTCHALQNYGVDRYKRRGKLSVEKELARQKEREQYVQSQVNDMWRTVPTPTDKDVKIDRFPNKPDKFPSEPQENILYFLEKNAPKLETWQREIIRIVRKIAQYFYPQRQTKVMNEGFATFVHYTIMHRLREKGLITDGFMMEFMRDHTNVVYQPPYDSKWYNGINPYALGFAMFQDIRRICENPTDEDREWFPDIAGNPDWMGVIRNIVANFKDDSFILQYLSPKVMRDFKLFALRDPKGEDEYEITAIHNEEGYKYVRRLLAKQHDPYHSIPNIQVISVDRWGNRGLTLMHTITNGRLLERKQVERVLSLLHVLWKYDVVLKSVTEHGEVKQTYSA